MITLPKVLFYEDPRDESFWWDKLKFWRDELGGEIEIIYTYSLDKTEEWFADDLDIGAIVITSASLDQYIIKLARSMRKNSGGLVVFHGPIIFASNSENDRATMMSACNHQCAINNLPQLLRSLRS